MYRYILFMYVLIYIFTMHPFIAACPAECTPYKLAEVRPVCVYICIYIYIFVYIYICVCIYVYIYVYMYLYI